MSARILIIDPDSEAIDAYQKALAPKAASWTIACVQTAAEAIEHAETTPPDIAISALCLDQGEGLKLLSRIIDLAPLAHAFIAATESDKPQLAAAFEGGCRYLPRPCSPEKLMLELQRCLALDSWLENPVAKEIVASRSDFESLPRHHLNIVNALNSSNVSLDAVVEAISADLALSAKVLETVNTSFYGFDQSISDLKQAASILGLSTVRNIVLAVNIFNKVGKSSEHQALVTEIWHHSIAVAGAARRISLHETKNAAAAEEAYSAGLLHDIGKLVLLGVVPEEFMQAQRLARDESLSSWQAEYKILGCDHAEVGAYLLSRWGLPQPLSEATALHHRPANACQKAFSTLAAVHAANAIVRKRRNPQHADATPASPYLEEIGKADTWEDWEAIAAGSEPPSQKKLSIKPKEKPVAEKTELPQITTTQIAHAALSKTIEEAEEKRNRPSPHPRGQSTALAFAAGIICCLCCIYFLSTIKDAPAKSSRAATLADKPKPPAIESREDILEEILESNVKPVRDVAHAPTEPAAAPPPPPPPFPKIQLGAIFQRTTGAKAQVNGRILGVGDTIDGAKVISIDRISIEVEHYQRIRTFSLD